MKTLRHLIKLMRHADTKEDLYSYDNEFCRIADAFLDGGLLTKDGFRQIHKKALCAYVTTNDRLTRRTA